MTPLRFTIGAAALLLSPAAWAGDMDKVRTALKTTLPNTEISSVQESILPGLFEVVTGRNLLYVEKTGRYALIGTLYDLTSHVDLTAKRRDALGLIADETHPVEPQMQPIPWEKLPQDAAIVTNPGAPFKLAVFADVNCPYCQRLHEQLKTQSEIEVHTYLLALWERSVTVTETVLCTPDNEGKTAALDQAFQGVLETPPEASCDTDARERINTFAKAHGIIGTPFLVRTDGATATGLKTPEALLGWLTEATQ